MKSKEIFSDARRTVLRSLIYMYKKIPASVTSDLLNALNSCEEELEQEKLRSDVRLATINEQSKIIQSLTQKLKDIEDQKYFDNLNYKEEQIAKDMADEKE